MIWRTVGILAVSAITLAACATAPVPPPQASLENIQALRAGDFAPLRVGDFVAGPGAPSLMDRTITVRAGTQTAPGGSYARFLGDTLEAELKGAGKFDPGAALVITGVVTNTHVDSALPTARAELEARFTLKRAGAVVFDKTLDAQSSWDSELLGAVAIPDAFNHYDALFAKLVTNLLSDPEFKVAARRSGA